MYTLFNVENVEKHSHFPVKSRCYCILTSPNLLLNLNHDLNKRFLAYNSCRFEAIRSVCLLRLYKMAILTSIGALSFPFNFRQLFCFVGFEENSIYLCKSGPNRALLSTSCLYYEINIFKVGTPLKHTSITSFGVCIYTPDTLKTC